MFVLKEYRNKELALAAEQAIILFMTIQEDPRFINGMYEHILNNKLVADYLNKSKNG